MNIPIWAIALVILSTILASSASLFLKIGTKKITFKLNINFFYKNIILFLGLFCYALASILGIIAYKGGELSILYPLASLSYIWTMILAVTILNEKMNKYKYFSVLLIIIGITLIIK